VNSVQVRKLFKYSNIGTSKVLILLDQGKASILNLQIWAELEIWNKIWNRAGPGPQVSGPNYFLTTRTGCQTRTTHHRPGHHTVTALTVESAQAPNTARRCRCPCRGKPYLALWRVPSPFPSSPCTTFVLHRSWPPLCSTSSATFVHCSCRPSWGTALPPPPLHVEATMSPSHWPAMPERAIH
jgi:hypothetical protein